jgi:hypothetical protein
MFFLAPEDPYGQRNWDGLLGKPGMVVCACKSQHLEGGDRWLGIPASLDYIVRPYLIKRKERRKGGRKEGRKGKEKKYCFFSLTSQRNSMGRNQRS